MLEELFVEVAGVSAQVTDQVADLGPNACVFVANESVQVNIDVCVMNWLIELFGDPGKLRN